MTSDFSEAGEQAEGYLAVYEFPRLEDKAVEAAATGRAGRDLRLGSLQRLPRGPGTIVRGVGRSPAPSLRPPRLARSPGAASSGFPPPPLTRRSW